MRRRDSYLRNEPIALFGERLNIQGLRSSVAQGYPDLPDTVVQSLVKLDESRIAPDASAQMFARNDFAGFLKQRSQNAQRLGLNLDTTLPTEKSFGQGIEFKVAETQPFVTANIHPRILYFQ
jgi:hypothetical protein